MTALARLQQWFLNQCDGDWEHENGIHIETLDNPGWSVKVNVIGTKVEGKTFASVSIPEDLASSDLDWIFLRREGDVIMLSCGPQCLERGVNMLCDWLESD